jgi:hypothetical protein
MKTFFNLLNPSAKAAHIARTQHPRGLITISIPRSKMQRGMGVFAFIASAVLLAIAQLPLWLTPVGWLALAGYALWRRQKSKHRVEEIQLLPDDQILLRWHGALETAPARIAGRIFVSPAVVAFRVEGERSGAIMLTPDQMPAAQFRALRVRLKHLREPNETANPL